MSFQTLSIFFAAFLVISTIFFSIKNDSPYLTIFANITFLTLNLFVIFILFYVTKKSVKYGKNAQRGWFLITLSLVATISGNIIWSILYLIFSQYPNPSVADIFYLAYYPLFIMGILYLPVTQRNQSKKYQILLDTGILMISIAMGLWVILINPILGANYTNNIDIAISLSYTFLDFFLLFILFYLISNWFGQVKKVPLTLLALSAAALIITSIIFTYKSLYGAYIPGGFLDMGWSISYFLTALAGVSYIEEEKTALYSFIDENIKFLYVKFNWSSYLPVLWLFFIFILLFYIYTDPENADSSIIVVAGIIITMVFIRQVMALDESNHGRKLLQKNQDILEKREQQLSLITDNMMDLIVQTNPKGIYEYVSPSVTKILGYHTEDMLDRNFLDFIHPDDVKDVKSSIKIAKNNFNPIKAECRYKKASGDYIWFENMGTTIFDNKNNIKGFVCCSRNIDDRKNAERLIKSSLEEKEVLLKEIHHRVKNNMQIISSLLSLQSRYINDKDVTEIFKESQNRVRSMAMIHENLYRTSNLARINLYDYIQNLVSGLYSSYGVNPHLIPCTVDVEEISLDVDKSISCGLIINELISNSLKYAFPQSEGKINLILRRFDEINLEMIVTDNGVGFPENLNFKKTESLGLQLVNTLVNQLEGDITLEKINGTKFTIKFPEYGI